MIELLCPHCRAPLAREQAVWKCENKHCFDVARQGYVNLLPVTQKRSVHPGDTREMVAARREFLAAGHYAPIAQTLRALVREFAPQAQTVLDVGCGEGYYLGQLAQIPERWGVDISKQAVRCAAARDKTVHWLTATAVHLPFARERFDLLLSMFALSAAEEFSRVLKPDGIFVQVLAGAAHLPALRSIIYPQLLQKEKQPAPLPGFSLLHTQTLRFSFTLETALQVQQLLAMTPHFWRIRKENAEALAQTQRLCEKAEVIFHIYRRQSPENLVK